MAFKIAAYELKEQLDTIVSWCTSMQSSTTSKELASINSKLLSEIQHILGGKNSETEVTGLIGRIEGVSRDIQKMLSDNLARNAPLTIPGDLVAIISASQAQQAVNLKLVISYLERARAAVTLQTADTEQEDMIADLKMFKEALEEISKNLGHFQVTIEEIPLSTTPENNQVSRLHLPSKLELLTQRIKELEEFQTKSDQRIQELMESQVESSQRIQGLEAENQNLTTDIIGLKTGIMQLAEKASGTSKNLPHLQRGESRFFSSTIAPQAPEQKSAQIPSL